jgi:hypothetical protein
LVAEAMSEDPSLSMKAAVRRVALTVGVVPHTLRGSVWAGAWDHFPGGTWRRLARHVSGAQPSGSGWRGRVPSVTGLRERGMALGRLP